MAFCDFCNCDNCRYGAPWLSHAQTADGRWICNVCYSFDLCTSGPNRNPNGPCEDLECEHRPKIVSDWTAYQHRVK